MKVQTQQIVSPNTDISLCIRREDLLHPLISGNKYRKLKYNLLRAHKDRLRTLLTFGGAYSNHIAAVAAAGREFGFRTIGLIRGEELADQVSLNPTLRFASECGMKLEFVSRETYRNRAEIEFINSLNDRHGPFYLIPEGGTNELAVKGCEQILSKDDFVFDYICCAVGTGGTISGIANSSFKHQQVLGFPALKGDFLNVEISKFTKRSNWELISGFDFGGYAKVNEILIDFMNEFKSINKILLDPVYTAKMVFGVMELIQSGYFPQGSKILMIHTGGLQGIAGMNEKLKNKHLPLIDTDD